ncbi:MAG: ImmA/IrrE family metallo-endopeptidase [Chloroflexota bacterium]
MACDHLERSDNYLSLVQDYFEQARNLIIGRARNLLNRLVEDRGNDEPPFLPEEYAHLVGIKRILREELEKVGAILLRLHDGLVIKVNIKEPAVRQRFSCAHEIAHVLYRELKLEHYINNIEYRSLDSRDDRVRNKAKERLCDIAATELLMPEVIFRKYLADSSLSIHAIERTANIFKVSIQTAAIRIAEVSEEPCIMLLWRMYSTKRSKSKSLRLAWRVGPGTKLRGREYYMPVHVTCPSSVYEAYRQSATTKCFKLFKLDNTVKRLPMESQGFGYGENRYVISLAFPNS